MASYFVYLILCGISLTVMVWLIRINFKKREEGDKNDLNDQDGGVKVPIFPDLDLPPGVSLPSAPVNDPIYEDEFVA